MASGMVRAGIPKIKRYKPIQAFLWFGWLYTIAVKKSLKKQNKRFFYFGMVPPSVAASDVFGRTDTRIRKRAQFALYSCFPAVYGI
jgi:hypothetical protein